MNELGVDRAWAELHRHLSWSTSFVVVFVFAPTRGQAASLGEQVSAWANPATLDRQVATDAGDLRTFARSLDSVLGEASRAQTFSERRLVWVDGVCVPEVGAGSAWAELLARLNERREPMRESLRGLIIVAPLAARARFAALAPDLWSIRASSLVLPAPTMEGELPEISSEPVAAEPDEIAAARARIENLPKLDGREGAELLAGLATHLRAHVRLARVTRSGQDFEHCRALFGRANQSLAQRLVQIDAPRTAGVDLLRAWLEFAELVHTFGDRELVRGVLAAATHHLRRLTEPRSLTEHMLAVELCVLDGEHSYVGFGPSDLTGFAEASFRQAQSKLDVLMRGASSPLSIRIALGLARTARHAGRIDEAEEHYERAAVLGAGVVAARELGSMLVESGEFERGMARLCEAVELADKIPDRERVLTRRALARALERVGQLDDARGTLEQARDLAAPDSSDTADCLDDLSSLLRALGEEASARRALGRALVLRRQLLGERHPLTLATEKRLGAMAARSLVILHLSDLHFGPHSRFDGIKPRAIAERFTAAIERIRAEAGLAEINLVLVTGDISESGHKKQFDTARSFFELLGGALGLPRDRFVFAPGNHDISRPHIQRERANQQIEDFDDDELARRIAAQKFVNYHDFVKSFYGEFGDDVRRHALEPTGWIHEFPELRVSIGVLNSSEVETDRERGGSVSAIQAQALLGSWLRPGAPPWLRILMVHHNPHAEFPDNVHKWLDWLRTQATQIEPEIIEHFAADAFGLRGKELLKSIARDARVQLVLHGHVHTSEAATWPWLHSKGATPVLAAGSCALREHKLPAAQPAMFQLISLDFEHAQLDIHRLRYEPRARETGQIELGTFVADDELAGGHEILNLSLPDGFVLAPEPDSAPAHDTEASFWKEYRTRLRDRHVEWELGAMQRGTRQLAAPTLDEMYVPLRLDAGYDMQKLELGTIIGPDELLARERNLIVRGSPGSGKSTWLRWLFRRLIGRSDVLVVLIELRELARAADGSSQSFDSYLFSWVERYVGAGWEDDFRAALRSQHGPRPVLLLDGWDELGDQGKDFRAKLDGFAAAHPRVLVVATSRPFGVDVPRQHERYDELQLQPMSDPEVTQFVHNVYRHVHRVEGQSVEHEVARFSSTLALNPQAQALGRTPLLLVMLLMVGGDAPLPDQRSELYRVCLENLLDTRPRQRHVEGVLQNSGEWAPLTYAERLRAVATLALFMQERHFVEPTSFGRRDAIATRRDLEHALPEHWEPHQRAGFLRWLVSGAGVMNEYDDDTFSFAHLGFQEYLAAWQLEVTHSDVAQRRALIERHGKQPVWWETLRLWASLVDARGPENLEAVVHESSDVAHDWLFGAMFADGVCESGFREWLRRGNFNFGWDAWRFARLCAEAWKGSQQQNRKVLVADALRGRHESNWIEWSRMAAWWDLAGLPGVPDPPLKGAPQSAVIEARASDTDFGESHVARGRVWVAASPIWPDRRVQLLGLRLWPSHRRWSGWLVQTGATLGLTWASLLRVNWPRAQPIDLNDAVRLTMDHFNTAPDEGWTASTSVSVADSYRYLLMLDPQLVEKYSYSFTWYYPEAMSCKTNAALIIDQWVLHVSSGRSAPIDAVLRSEPWHQELSYIRAHSSAYAGTRVALTYTTGTDPLLALLRTACQLSLDPTRDPTPLHEQASTFAGHPIWPALARHVARISTAEDRAYLIDLARNPDQVEDDILRWGLQYWIRGDIMLDDGSVHLLDEIWLAQGREPLPYLEDMLPELDIDWDTILAERARENAD